MKFYITGISGFIAKHLCKRLIADGHEVHAVAGGTTIGKFESWMHHKNFQVVDSFMLRVHKYDFVIHFAATTSITNEFNPGIWQNNAVFAEMVMNSPFRTVYASSTSAYELNNPYAHSKAFLEHLGARHGNALGLRLFNVYGPGNNKGIVKRTIDCCLNAETLTLQGGDQVRDFIYIDDVVDIIIQHLDNPLKIMDVGTGIGTSMSDIVMLIGKQMNSLGYSGICKKENSDYTGEQKISIAQCNPVKNYTPLSDGIRKTIEETLKNVK